MDPAYVGTRNIRAMSIIQELLGNMGIAGGESRPSEGNPTYRSTDYGFSSTFCQVISERRAIRYDPSHLQRKENTKTKESNSLNW